MPTLAEVTEPWGPVFTLTSTGALYASERKRPWERGPPAGDGADGSARSLHLMAGRSSVSQRQRGWGEGPLGWASSWDLPLGDQIHPAAWHTRAPLGEDDGETTEALLWPAQDVACSLLSITAGCRGREGPSRREAVRAATDFESPTYSPVGSQEGGAKGRLSSGFTFSQDLTAI